MLKASKTCACWGFAATLLLAFVGITAAPAPAQTPQPDPLASLLPNLLAPLAPILNPQPQQPAGPSGGQANQPATKAPVAVNNVPPNPEVHCGGTPQPLSFARTPGRNTQPLVDAANKLVGPGGIVQQVLISIAAPFPVAGPAQYRDDWGEPRRTPCPHLHQGNDIFANFGVPFVAPEGGVVSRYGFESVGGNAVYFSGDDGYSFYGAHLQSFGPNLRIGVHVVAGTILGYVGDTGDAAGGAPHLHFQLYPPGHGFSTPVDPKFWLDASLNTAITKAGGVVPPEGGGGAGGAPGLDIGGLMSSVLLAGGHIISQPTVPVLLFVLLVLGTLGIAQRRTLKVAVERRRSRSSAEVPIFLVAASVIAAREAASATGSRRKRRGGTGPPGVPEEDRPIWARGAVPAGAPERKPSAIARMVGAAGRAWARFPTMMSGVSSSKSSGGKQESGGASQASFASWSPSAYPSNGNGIGHPNGNGRAHAIRRSGKSQSTGSWTPTAAGGSRFARR